ncbi:MAG: hypothetical protein HYS60_01340 [Candidatus Wildermuthbacteria bacterium]|nr:hypothetical protein [Candidatus Wildermuthbacteria bacterium]
MEIFLDGPFYNPTKGNLKLPEVLDEIQNYMKEKPEYQYEVIVGCDSSATEDPFFPVVVLVWRKLGGGRFFLKRIHYSQQKFYNLHQRILQEVFLSCQLALHLRDSFKDMMKKKSPEISYEFQYIHADIGENGPTRSMIKEVTGLIRGNGFEPKIKPESFAASTVADRYS